MELLDNLGALLWGGPALALFLSVGVYMTYCSGLVQLRRFGAAMRATLGGFLRGGGAGGVSPLQALSTALGGTVGTGNIAGVTLSLALGGPGVLFWMWVSGFVGMATKYSEVLLAVKYRERDKSGARVGGPMYYIKNGLGRRFMPLAYCFAAAGALAAPGMGSAVQAGEIRSALSTLAGTYDVSLGDGFPLAVGLVVAACASAVLCGGAGRLGRASALLVPGMSALYILVCLAVIGANSERLLPCLGEIVRGAFRPEAGLAACVGWGLRRGVFSNEAGMGSSPIAHAASSERDCARQGLAGVFEVFADTIVICTLTGLALLTSGVLDGADGATTALNARAIAGVFGEGTAALILAASITLFAFSSLLSWGMYGSRCFAFLTRGRFERAYLAVFCACAALGAAAELNAVWLLSDILNALMAAPNLAALLLLGGEVKAETRRYFSKGK